MPWWNQIFARKEKSVVRRDLSSLYADMHAHLVPGIDDGAATLEEALQMVEQMSQLGLRTLWLTPHIHAAHYPNTPQTIRAAFEPLQREVQKRKLPVRIHYAAEYYLDEHFEQLLERDELLTLPGRRVLVELSFLSPPHALEERFFRIQLKGYRPVLAHPERYGYWHRDLKYFARLKEKGCELQVNLLSLAGAYGKRIQQIAQKMLEAGQVDFLGSDCHHHTHVELLADWLQQGRFRLPENHALQNAAL